MAGTSVPASPLAKESVAPGSLPLVGASPLGGSPQLGSGDQLIGNHGGSLVTEGGAGLLTEAGAGVVSNNGSGFLQTSSSTGADGGNLAIGQQTTPECGGGATGGGGVLLPGATELGGVPVGVASCGPATGGSPQPPAPVTFTGARLSSSTGASFGGVCAARGPLTVSLRTLGNLPIMDAAGHAQLTATVGADGSFAFQGFQPTATVLLVAELGAGKGQLMALVPPGGDQHLVLDLASSLVAIDLITDVFQNEDDPAQLTPASLAALREGVAAAYKAAPSSPGDADAVVAAVAAWRRQTPALDAAMGALEAALVKISQAALGVGKTATDVPLDVLGLAAAGDGSLYLAVDGAVLHVRADGWLEAAIGSGRGNEVPLDGADAASVAITPDGPLAVDAGGRLLALVVTGDHDTLVRREPDGKLHELGPWGSEDTGLPLALAADADGSVRLLERQQEVQAGKAAPYVVWTWAPGASTPTAGAVSKSVAPPSLDGHDVTGVDGKSRILLWDGSGASVALPTGLPAKATEGGPFAATAPDGTLYVSANGQVWRIQAGAAVLVAGARSE